jgi:hypothetical protein
MLSTMTPMRETEPGSVSAALLAHLRQDIAAAGGWIPFPWVSDPRGTATVA